MILSLFARHQINCHIYPFAIISIPTFHFNSWSIGGRGPKRNAQKMPQGRNIWKNAKMQNNVLDI